MRAESASHSNCSGFVGLDYSLLGTKGPKPKEENAFLDLSLSFTIIFTHTIQTLAY